MNGGRGGAEGKVKGKDIGANANDGSNLQRGNCQRIECGGKFGDIGDSGYWTLVDELSGSENKEKEIRKIEEEVEEEVKKIWDFCSLQVRI
jgi:hypothetical protein